MTGRGGLRRRGGGRKPQARWREGLGGAKAALQSMQPLSQLADQPLALGGAELVVPVEGLPQGGQLALLWLPEPGRWGAEGAPHEAAEGVSPALQIAEATIGLQL